MTHGAAEVNTRAPVNRTINKILATLLYNSCLCQHTSVTTLQWYQSMYTYVYMCTFR